MQFSVVILLASSNVPQYTRQFNYFSSSHFPKGFSMKLIRFFATSFVAVALVILAACDPVTPVTVTTPNPVDSLKATSIDAATVRLKWNASTTTNINGYRVTVLNSASGAAIGTTNVSGTTLDVNGLTAGTVYLFRVQTRTADTVSTAREIRWSPAVRVTTMQGGAVRIYETASGFGSGLRFQGGTALNLTVARGNEWDLGINTRSNDTLLIGTPDFIGYSAITNPRKTKSGASLYSNVDSLNQVFDTQVQMDAAGGNYPIILRNTTKGFVGAFQTVEGNFAKVFFKASPAGVILQGTAPDRYVEVEISYQPVANVPYALAPSLNPTTAKGFIDGVTFTKVTP